MIVRYQWFCRPTLVMNLFSSLVPTHSGRSRLSCPSIVLEQNHRLVVHGGMDSHVHDTANDIWFFDVTTSMWTAPFEYAMANRVDSIAMSLRHASMTVNGAVLLFYGGVTSRDRFQTPVIFGLHVLPAPSSNVSYPFGAWPQNSSTAGFPLSKYPHFAFNAYSNDLTDQYRNKFGYLNATQLASMFVLGLSSTKEEKRKIMPLASIPATMVNYVGGHVMVPFLNSLLVFGGFSNVGLAKNPLPLHSVLSQKVQRFHLDSICQDIGALLGHFSNAYIS
jgi:hypothetical protein